MFITRIPIPGALARTADAALRVEVGAILPQNYSLVVLPHSCPLCEEIKDSDYFKEHDLSDSLCGIWILSLSLSGM